MLSVIMELCLDNAFRSATMYFFSLFSVTDLAKKYLEQITVYSSKDYGRLFNAICSMQPPET